MIIHVFGRHLALGDDQISHAEAEAEKLGRFFDGVNEVKVTFERLHAETLKAEIVCTVSGGRTLVAVETGRTVDEALEAASDNMSRQIKKYKAKLRDHRAHGAPWAEAPEVPAPPEQDPEADPVEDE